jgi:hypothetical protein
LIAAALTAPLYGQTDLDARVLVPVFTVDPLPGANGSSWTTDLWLSNGGTETESVFGVSWDCLLPECGFLPAPIEPGRTFRPELLGADGALHGALLYVSTASGADVHGGLRFRDLSRQASTWGTELPLPREADFHAGAFSLVDVPVDPGFRQTLRIYEIEMPQFASVRVRTFRLDPDRSQPTGDSDELLGETIVPLQYPDLGGVPLHPGYAEVTDLSTLAPLGDAQRVRLEIAPATPGLRLWAFVTVIHNETQHATVITPQ